MSEVRIILTDAPHKYQSWHKWSQGARAKRLVSRIERQCSLCKQTIAPGTPHYAVNALLYTRVCESCGDARPGTEP